MSVVSMGKIILQFPIFIFTVGKSGANTSCLNSSGIRSSQSKLNNSFNPLSLIGGKNGEDLGTGQRGAPATD